ncbi:MAG: PP2C family protein-serine/threonine phosphatase [Chloroflexota bacterium]
MEGGEVRLEAACLTDTGMLREENEDSAWAQLYTPAERDPLGLFIVCDGMGGHMGGKYASYWAVEAIKQEFAELFVAKDPRATLILSSEDIKRAQAGLLVTPQPPPAPDLEQLTQSAVQKANHVVHQYAQHKPATAANAGTTVTMAVVSGAQAVIANAGDSRTYLLRNHELRQLSRDHSLVAHLVAEGVILPTDLYTHPQRNVIYRYLGEQGDVLPDLYRQELQPGDYLLLCSDGLWEMLRSEEQTVYLVESAPDLPAACQALVDAANKAGGEDNISVVIVKVS